jgi:uncharacterized protein YkwD
VARIRLTLAVAATAVSAWALAGMAPAQGAHAPAHRHSGIARCQRTVRVHSGSRYVLHRVRVRCRRHAVRRRTRARRRTHGHAAPRHLVRRAGPLRRAPRSRSPRRRTSAADVNGQCGDTSLTPTLWNVERVRASVLCLVNHERTVRGESPLAQNAALAQAAQSHTESMAFGDYFEHVGPHGDTPVDRARSAGYITDPRRGFEVGENIAWGTLWLSSPREIVAAWMASAGHRANILNPRYRDTAVGVSPHPPAVLAHGQHGGIYTQDFGVITR